MVDPGHIKHPHPLLPEMGVESFPEPEGIPLACQVGMRDLAPGMHAAIGPSGGGQVGTIRLELVQRCLDDPLHRLLPGLALPAAVSGTVIFQLECETRHELTGCPSFG